MSVHSGVLLFENGSVTINCKDITKNDGLFTLPDAETETKTETHTMSGWPHSNQNEIPCVFPVLHKFSLCYFYAKTNNLLNE